MEANMESISVSMLSPTNPSPAIAPAHPELAVKQIDGKIDPLEQAKRLSSLGLVTRKEWVIPPRPKPGRKPATDTPPTKRKAQNRAAQRAFRERRAARVGELEKKLEEVKEEQKQRETSLRSKIRQLEAEMERLKVELNSWKLRYNNLDTAFEYEKRAKEASSAELVYLQKGTETACNDVAPLPREFRNSKTEDYHIQPDPGPNPISNTAACAMSFTKSQPVCIEDNFANTNAGCGNCILNSRCACIEDTLDSLKMDSTSEYERSRVPLVDTFHEKYSHQSNPCTPLETDFTTHLSMKPTEAVTESIGQILPTESCGFCEEGTYCLCAEAVAAAASCNGQQQNCSDPFLNKTKSSEVDFTNYRKVFNQTNVGQKNLIYGNGPGTCKQCQTNPLSRAFCRSLSVLQRTANESSEDCCGKVIDGDCCKSAAILSTEQPRLSCSDAYKAISSHKNYDRANSELSSWLCRLRATPPSHPGRCPLEVEAASVMKVLCEFDRRFGRE